MHNNLFANAHSRAEVKEGLEKDQIRDEKTLRIFDTITGLCVAVLVRDMATIDIAAIF